jgi:hypothetical protein
MMIQLSTLSRGMDHESNVSQGCLRSFKFETRLSEHSNTFIFFAPLHKVDGACPSSDLINKDRVI